MEQLNFDRDQLPPCAFQGFKPDHGHYAKSVTRFDHSWLQKRQGILGFLVQLVHHSSRLCTKKATFAHLVAVGIQVYSRSEKDFKSMIHVTLGICCYFPDFAGYHFRGELLVNKQTPTTPLSNPSGKSIPPPHQCKSSALARRCQVTIKGMGKFDESYKFLNIAHKVLAPQTGEFTN